MSGEELGPVGGQQDLDDASAQNSHWYTGNGGEDVIPGSDVVPEVAPERGPPRGSEVVKKKRKRETRKFQVEDLLKDTGLEAIYVGFRDFKANGVGHELSDLKRLFRRYDVWSNRMYPNAPFSEIVARVDKMSKAPIKNRLNEMRGREQMRAHPELRDQVAIETVFAEAERRRDENVAQDAENSDADVITSDAQAEGSGSAVTSESVEKVGDSARERIARNRQLAFEKRKAREEEKARAEAEAEYERALAEAADDDDEDEYAWEAVFEAEQSRPNHARVSNPSVNDSAGHANPARINSAEDARLENDNNISAASNNDLLEVAHPPHDEVVNEPSKAEDFFAAMVQEEVRTDELSSQGGELMSQEFEECPVTTQPTQLLGEADDGYDNDDDLDSQAPTQLLP